MKEKYYVVYEGRQQGIYFDTWDNVKKLIEGYPKGLAKKYKSLALARLAYGAYRGLNARVRKVKL